MSITIGRYELVETPPDTRDPRGIIWCWDAPVASATYVLGVDPTHGIQGWHRSLRRSDDVKTDNACIQVLKVGSPDVQVAEFAAPIDPYELATVVNALGRIYCGGNEEGQALAAIEVQPGPGWATQTELANRFGYINIPPWRYYADTTQGNIARGKFGWYSNRNTRRDLWMKGTRHVSGRHVTINSPWLIEEMADCVQDNFLSFTARAQYGAHDDRVVAFLIACWYAHDWFVDLTAATETAAPEASTTADYQRTAISYDEMMDDWQDRFAQLSGEG